MRRYQHPYVPGEIPALCGECGAWLERDRTCPNAHCPSNTPTEIVPVTSMADAVARLRASDDGDIRTLRGRQGAAVRGGNGGALRQIAQQLRCPSCHRGNAIRPRDGVCKYCGARV